MPEQLSIIVLTLNEELFIERCLRSVLWANEIVVLDSCSQDKTQEIARSLGANVYEQPWLGWSAQRTKAISLAKNDWVFVLECDEIVTEELASSIQKILVSTPLAQDVYSVDRRGDFLGMLLPNMSSKKRMKNFVRIFNRKYSAYDPTMKVHEEVRFSGKARLLRGVLLHWRGYVMDEYIPVFNRYATTEAEMLHEKGIQANVAMIMYRPILRFIWCFFIQGGFRVGTRGVIHAMLKATSEYIRYSKLWEMQNAKKTLHPPQSIYLDNPKKELDTLDQA